MTPLDNAGSTESGGAAPVLPLPLPLRQKVVLVMDLVESVRLMAADEVAVIDQWRGFVRFAMEQALPRHAGRLVKSLGDGLMAEFDSATEAAATALELQQYFAPVNRDLPEDKRLYLRAGINATHVYVDEIDIYGSGVNLAARVASLAGPGETLVTAEARDHLTDGLTVDLEDLGDCYLKHLKAPVRAYRIGPAGPHPPPPAAAEAADALEAAVAVIPFSPLASDQDHPLVLGDAIADDVIAALSQGTGLRVIARLSAAPFRGAQANLHDIRALLGAAYVIFGQYSVADGKARIRATLCATKDGQVLWADGMTAGVADIFHGQDQVVPAIAANAGRVILQKELERTRLLPLSNLESYTLYVSGISMLHRSSRGDFVRSREVLEHLSQRHPNRPAPYAMTAKWHLMRILQGWSSDPADDVGHALDLARRALRCDPENAFALATEGFVAAHSNGDLPLADARCAQALQIDPQDPQVWRMRATVHCYQGDGEEAESYAMRALSLTPLDPTRFIYQLVVGASKLARGRHDEALEWADKSLRGNVMHVPTHRLRVIALVLAGRDAEAREAAQELLRIAPHFSVDAFARNYPGRRQAHAESYFDALRRAGLPA